MLQKRGPRIMDLFLRDHDVLDIGLEASSVRTNIVRP